jgi:predicted transposase YdaD
MLAQKSKRTREEEAFVVNTQDAFEQLREEGRREGRDEGRREGRDEGRVEEAARAVLTALRVRGIAVPDAAREQILAERAPVRLERWLERAILAASVAEVLEEPS